MIERLASGARRVARTLWPHRDRLLLVVDDAGWILDEIGQQLATHLPPGLRTRVVSRDWTNARRCTIHFLSRHWAWSDGALDGVHPSNRLLGLWWHGRADSPDPQLQAALRRLQQVHDRFARVQVTCSIARETLLAIGVARDRIVQIPEGVDTVVFRPAAAAGARRGARRSLGIPDDATAIGCFQKDGDGWGAGDQPKYVKGPDVLVDALAALHRDHRLHVVLPGPARGYVTRRLAEAGVPFSAPGFVPRDQMPPIYHALDMYVSPSRDEGGPAGVLEAMASGIPVVSTRSGMAPDLIEDGVSGLLVPIDDAAALADAIGRLAGSAASRAAFAQRGRDVIAPYDWRIVVQRYASELYAF